MKALLVMLLVGICGIGLRSPEIMKAVGIAGSAQDPAISVSSLTASGKPDQQPMRMQEFAELAKNDTNAYQKFLGSHQRDPERSEVDKLMNFLARGKFE